MPQLPPLVAELRVKASDVHAKFGEAMKASDELARKSSGDASATGAAYDKMGRASGVAFLGMVGGIGTVVGASAHMAGDFQEKMTLLVTGAGESEDKVKAVANGILAMAPQVDTSASSLADGMYMIESAGFHGASGLSVLKAAAEGAKVGNADMSTTADALTTVLKDYHLPASAAATVTSQLVATVASGKTHMQDLAASMASILPFSSGLGVSLKDTMGAMATMTGQGVQASNAATYLKFTMMALANETPKGAKALASVGLSSMQVATDLKSKGLSGTLGEITDAIGKKFPRGSAQYVKALADAVGGTRGMAAALALTGQNMPTYQANIKKIGSATTEAGGNVQGFGKSSEDLNNKLASMGAAFESAGIKLGTALIPAMTAAVDKAMELFGFLQSHQAIVTGLAIGFGSLTAVFGGIYVGVKVMQAWRAATMAVTAAQVGLKYAQGFSLALTEAQTAATASGTAGYAIMRTAQVASTAAQWLFNAAMSANPIMLVVLGLIALGAAVVIAYNKIGWFKDFVNGAFKLIQTVVGSVVNWFKSSFVPWLSEVWTMVAAGASVMVNLVKGYFTMWLNIALAVVNWFKGSMVPWFQSVWAAVQAGLSVLVNFFASGWAMIRSATGIVVAWFQSYVLGTVQSVFSWIGNIVIGAVNYFNQFGGGVRGVIGGVFNLFVNLPVMIANALANLGGILFNAGVNAIQGLINGIGSMIGNVGKAIGNVVGAIANFLPHSPAKKGPLSGRGYTLYSGQKMIEDLGVGMLNGIDSVSGASNAVMLASLPNTQQLGGAGLFGPGPVGVQGGAGSMSAQAGGSGHTGGGKTVTNTINVYAQTNADPHQIAAEMGYQLLLQG